MEARVYDIKATDQLLVTIENNGVMRNYCTSNYTSLNDVVQSARVHEQANSGLSKLKIRNKTKGWNTILLLSCQKAPAFKTIHRNRNIVSPTPVAYA